MSTPDENQDHAAVVTTTTMDEMDDSQKNNINRDDETPSGYECACDDPQDEEDHHSATCSSSHYDKAVIHQQEQFQDQEDLSAAADEENLFFTGTTRFRLTCHFVARIGLAAFKYGSPAFRVETFMKALMSNFGYDGLFRISNTELFSAFSETEDTDQFISVMDIESAELNLYRLGKLSDIVKSVLNDGMTQSQALQELRDLENGHVPFGRAAVFATYIVVGGGLTALFRGSWYDMLVAAVCSVPIYLLTIALPTSFAKALPFLSSAVASLIATVIRQYAWPNVHAGIIVLSSIAIQLPGYGVSLAVSELLSHHITSGLDRLVHALIELALLVAGAWAGSSLLQGLGTFPANAPTNDDAIPLIWLTLFGPLLMLSLCIQFQTSLRDFPWSFLNLAIAFGTSFLGILLQNPDAGVFLAALLITIFAQLWARWKDRPRSIVLVPSLVLLVSGSVGFRGLVNWTAGSREDGVKQFLQMFIVAFTIIGGVLVGSVLVHPNTTL